MSKPRGQTLSEEVADALCEGAEAYQHRARALLREIFPMTRHLNDASAVATIARALRDAAQSESDDALREANARAGALHYALAVADAAINPTDKSGISMFDWNERLKKATGIIRKALALTPYVRQDEKAGK